MNEIQLMQGDCLELMKDIPDGFVDLTVTSPPYDNLRTYNGNIDQWCFEKFQAIARELYRITKRGGVVVWVVGDATVKGSETGTSFRQALYFKECGFNIHDTMIWEKDSFSYPDVSRYRACFEYMFVFSKGRPATVNLIADRKNKYAGTVVHGTNRLPDGTTFRKSNDKKSNVAEFGVRFNVWKIPGEKNNTSGHPAVFPEQLAQDHILSWSNPGDVVFDPFLGSGTTAKMSVLNNRRFIGMELDPGYFEIAEKRITRGAKSKTRRTFGGCAAR